MNKPLTINDVDELSGRQFEFFTGKLLKKLNYHHIKVTRASGDHGLDVLATDRIGRRIGIQCKLVAPHAYIGFGAIQETFTGKALYHTNVGIVLTNGRLNKNAVKSANKLHIKYWSRNTLRELLDITNNIVKPKHKPKHHKHKKHKYTSHNYTNKAYHIKKSYKKSVKVTRRKQYVYSDHRVKYSLKNPIIKHGLLMMATGVGGISRTMHTLHYFKQNGYSNMKYNSVYFLFQRAKKSNPTLAQLNKQFHYNLKKKIQHNRKERAIKRINQAKSAHRKAIHKHEAIITEIGQLKRQNRRLKRRIWYLTTYLNKQNN